MIWCFQVCVDKPCYPVEELVAMEDVECETLPAQCYTVAEEECTEEVVQDCQECKLYSIKVT